MFAAANIVKKADPGNKVPLDRLFVIGVVLFHLSAK